MGTSGSFKGSGGKAAGDLRDALADWLGDSQAEGSTPGDSESTDRQEGQTAPAPLSTSSLSSIFGMWGGAGSSSGGGSSGRDRDNNTGSSRPSRSSGGVQRTVARVAAPAGRASALARAYIDSDRDSLEAAGLNYDDLSAIEDPLEIGKRIMEAAFDTQPDSSIEDSESRMIVADLIAWILESPEDHPPTPDDVVRHSIELMVTRVALTEVGDTIRQEKNPTKRRDAEAEVKRLAKVYASQATLNGTGATAAEISTAIRDSVAELRTIYGEAE